VASLLLRSPENRGSIRAFPLAGEMSWEGSCERLVEEVSSLKVAWTGPTEKPHTLPSLPRGEPSTVPGPAHYRAPGLITGPDHDFTGTYSGIITNVRWNANQKVIETLFDKFPIQWGNWRMYVDNLEWPMEGGPGNAIVRPKALLEKPQALLSDLVHGFLTCKT
jgi:hypothetical protein